VRNLRRLRSFLLAGSFLAIGSVLASAQSTYFLVTMTGAQETPPNASAATGGGCIVLDQTAHKLHYNLSFSGLSAAESDAHIHCCAVAGQAGGVLFPLPLGTPISGVFTTTPAQETNILNGLAYVNFHTSNFPNGEIRGQMNGTPTTAPLPFCAGDGTGTACPCGNNSAAGANAGCLDSFGVGATLRATGVASIGCDTVSLNGASMPATTSALFFQGTTQVGAGTGAVFGDGLRCAGGSVIRLATNVTAGGNASFPGVGQPSVSVRGGVTVPGTRTYQAWYRNAAAFCQPDTFNLTNGLQLTWVL
jgi:hypothetical protein